MSQPATNTESPAEKVILPDENFWRCYCARLEPYIAVASAIAIHVAAFALVALSWMYLAAQIDLSMPPELEVATLESGSELFAGGGGSGGQGHGPGDGKRTIAREKVDEPGAADAKKHKRNDKVKLEPINPNQLDLKKQNDKDNGEVFVELQKQADEELAKAKSVLAKAMGVSAKHLATTGRVRTGGTTGTGGGIGSGKGSGVGSGRGKGIGNAAKGKRLTKAQRRELRWNINFSGSPVKHLKKLHAVNAVLAIPSANLRFFNLVDTSGKRPRFIRDNLVRYKDKVKWYNQDKDSLKGLTHVLRQLGLQMRYVPRYVVIFLPDHVADEMAQLEVAYKGKREDEITFTWFEIRQRPDGSFGPVVVAQK